MGHALVHSDMGMYVLVAAPQPGPPGWDRLTALVDEDPEGVGMPRFELCADDAARHHYARRPTLFLAPDRVVWISVGQYLRDRDEPR
ncbi:hypothetical protein [Streptomyces sp. NPDC003032]